MTWRDQYQAGSFRGASFRTEGHERSGGRRNVASEFPGRDEPEVEDLGRRARQFSLDCHVLGEDYFTDRDALLDALEAAGPGLLVHPWHGQMMVIVLDYSSSESTEEGGICRFRITFKEAGLAVPAPIALASADTATAEADAQAAAAPANFAKKFSIEKAAAFVEDSAGKIVSGMATATQLAAAAQGGVGPALRAFQAGLSFLPANISGLLRAPLSLASSIVGLVSAASALSTPARGLITALTGMMDWEPSDAQLPTTTPNRVQEDQNRQALLGLFRVATACELCRTAAAMTYVSYDDAVTVRQALADRFEARALEAADAGDDDTAQALDALRRAVTRDLAARGASLARLYAYEMQATEPALVVAQRIYGAADVEARAAEICERNGVAHPGFIPGGSTLQLLTSDTAST